MIPGALLQTVDSKRTQTGILRENAVLGIDKLPVVNYY